MSALSSQQKTTLRPMGPEDMYFLCELYGSTRQQEMARTGWPPAEITKFLTFQFHAQHQYYQEHYGDATFDVIMVDNQKAGRLYLQECADEFRIVDIALMPAFRGRGLGSELLNQIFQRARPAKKAVRIHVEKNNPALNLYQRLGFKPLEDKEVYLLMEWLP